MSGEGRGWKVDRQWSASSQATATAGTCAMHNDDEAPVLKSRAIACTIDARLVSRTVACTVWQGSSEKNKNLSRHPQPKTNKLTRAHAPVPRCCSTRSTAQKRAGASRAATAKHIRGERRQKQQQRVRESGELSHKGSRKHASKGRRRNAGQPHRRRSKSGTKFKWTK